MSALTESEPSSLSSSSNRRGEEGSILGIQAAGRSCRSFVAPLSHDQVEEAVSFSISEVLSDAPACLKCCLRHPH